MTVAGKGWVMVSFATFNVNNLFVRYRFTDHYQGQQKRVSELSKAEEAKFQFLPANILGKDSKNYRIFNAATRKVAGEVLKGGDGQLPDILCLQEVENLAAARIFNFQNLGTHYEYLLLVDSWDMRGIDVAVLSVHPIVDVVTHVDDPNPSGDKADPLLFSRDCLEVTVAVPKVGDVTFLVNHLKSKFVQRTQGMTVAAYNKKKLAGNQRRLLQAGAVKKIARRRFGQDPKALWAVIGDMNDMPLSPWIKPLVTWTTVTDVVRTYFPVEEQWTHYFASANKVAHLDHVLASPALAARIAKEAKAGRAPHIERSGIGYTGHSKKDPSLTLPANAHHEFIEDDGVTPIPKKAPPPVDYPFRFPREKDVAADPNNRASDHCPVKVWF